MAQQCAVSTRYLLSLISSAMRVGLTEFFVRGNELFWIKKGAVRPMQHNAPCLQNSGKEFYQGKQNRLEFCIEPVTSGNQNRRMEQT